MRIPSNVARGYFRCKIYAYYSLLADPLSCLLIIDYWVSLNVPNSKLSWKNRRKREVKKKKKNAKFLLRAKVSFRITKLLPFLSIPIIKLLDFDFTRNFFSLRRDNTKYFDEKSKFNEIFSLPIRQILDPK